MQWLKKMDAVLHCLNELKGDNPNLDDIIKWLKINYPVIETGEIQDITLYLWKEEFMYFETNGNRLAVYNDNDKSGHFLITCKGKLFIEGEGGFYKREKKKSQTASLQFWQTWAIVLGTVFGGLYGVFEIFNYFICK